MTNVLGTHHIGGDGRAAESVPIDPPRFRSLMATFPAGVAVVTTTGSDGCPQGMTCTAVCSVSDRPASVLVCMQRMSRTLAAIMNSRRFALNLLHDEATPVARLFARPGTTDRFDRVPWLDDHAFGGPHLLEAAHATADCRVAGQFVVGEHTVLIGEVYRLDEPAADPPSPLVYGMRRFWGIDSIDESSASR